MSENKLAFQCSKFLLGESLVAYLGDIISGQGVATDMSKVEAIQTWPTPTTMPAMQGFLGLTRYYCKFNQAYSDVAAPLT